jgi:hypothetical protein
MEICSCGSKTKACQQNNVKGSECVSCGRRIWNSKEDMAESRIQKCEVDIQSEFVSEKYAGLSF